MQKKELKKCAPKRKTRKEIMLEKSFKKDISQQTTYPKVEPLLEKWIDNNF